MHRQYNSRTESVRVSSPESTAFTDADIQALRMKSIILRGVSAGMESSLQGEVEVLCDRVNTQIESSALARSTAAAVVTPLLAPQASFESCPVCNRLEPLLVMGQCRAYSAGSDSGSCSECGVLCSRCEVTCRLVGPLDEVLRCDLCGAVQLHSYSTSTTSTSNTDTRDLNTHKSKTANTYTLLLSDWIHMRSNMCPYCSLIMVPF